MKEIHGRASVVVTAPMQSCFALLRAIDRYPTWNRGLVRDVDVFEWDEDDRPVKARARLHIAQSPFGKDFELLVAVRAQGESTVLITRIPNEPSDRERLELAWRLQGDGATRIDLQFETAVEFLPGFVPLGGVGDLIADTLLDAAAAALDASRA